ncbi:class I SAM-dependent methyltransferase [Actinoplanes sp. NPDC000266]
MTVTSSTYMFDNSTKDAAQQVRLLADILDPHTQAVLGNIFMDDDWRCLDLGSGGGSVARWLEANGIAHVVAMDRDTRYITATDVIEPRQQDLLDADLGDGEYDLIHARLLYMHLPRREELLARAARALKPGGYLVISDWDCTHLDDMLLTADDEVHDAFTAFQHTLIGLGEAVGMAPGWARRLPAAFRTAGLADVTGQVYNGFWTGGQPGMQLHACNSHQKEKALLDAGLTRTQLDFLRAGMEDPTVTGYSYPMYTAVGRRPR